MDLSEPKRDRERRDIENLIEAEEGLRKAHAHWMNCFYQLHKKRPKRLPILSTYDQKRSVNVRITREERQILYQCAKEIGTNPTQLFAIVFEQVLKRPLTSVHRVTKMEAKKTEQITVRLRQRIVSNWRQADARDETMRVIAQGDVTTLRKLVAQN